MSTATKTTLLLLLFIALGTGGYWYVQHRGQSSIEYQNTDPRAAEILAKLSLLVTLPTDEKPTIATVTDLAQLNGQALFAKAQLGDKVIIYAKAKRAILYRPAENKIIEVAPLNY